VLFGKQNKNVRGKRSFFYRWMGLVCECYNGADMLLRALTDEIFTNGIA
jgi:hypothetical protein